MKNIYNTYLRHRTMCFKGSAAVCLWASDQLVFIASSRTSNERTRIRKGSNAANSKKERLINHKPKKLGHLLVIDETGGFQ